MAHFHAEFFEDVGHLTFDRFFRCAANQGDIAVALALGD